MTAKNGYLLFCCVIFALSWHRFSPVVSVLRYDPKIPNSTGAEQTMLLKDILAFY
jgi:hypothetical protein